MENLEDVFHIRADKFTYIRTSNSRELQLLEALYVVKGSRHGSDEHIESFCY